MPQDCPDYSQVDADRLALEGNKWLAERKRLTEADKTDACTCRNSSFGMDVDRCPVHGNEYIPCG